MRARAMEIKVPCAGGCGRMETAEPYHDPEQVYCLGCGVRAGREDARRRQAERAAAAIEAGTPHSRRNT